MLYLYMYLYFLLWLADCSEAELTDQSGTLNTGICADRGFVNSSSIPDGVVCYNGTTAGSMAVYICNDGYILMGKVARVCQNGGNWNGSIPICIQEPSMYKVAYYLCLKMTTVMHSLKLYSNTIMRYVSIL